MSRYEYSVVPFIGRIKSGLFSTQNVTDVANQLSSVIQAQAALGWMFHSVNSVNIQVKPGCIASLFGRSAFFLEFDQIVFYREAQSASISVDTAPVATMAGTTTPTAVPPPIPK